MSRRVVRRLRKRYGQEAEVSEHMTLEACEFSSKT